MVEKARTGLAEVQAYEKDMILRAPIDGEVFEILNAEGELVPTGYPVVTLLKMKDPWITVHVNEMTLKDFPMNQSIALSIPALGEAVYEANVSYIAAQGSFATKVFTKDKGSFDLKTFEVRLRPTSQISQIRPGMTALIKQRM